MGSVFAFAACTPAVLRAQPVAETPAEAAPEPAPAATPAKGLAGVVVDAPTGEALIEARVEVISAGPARGKSATTDLDGRFTLDLPPGTYTLRVRFDIYPPRRIEGVVIEAGQGTALKVELSPSEEAVQEIVVEAKADRRTSAATLNERRRAAVVTDAVSAQEMSRAPDGNASDAVKRVTSTTVVDGRYVVLRGLGGRYTSTLFNGVRLPSPEPDLPAVPLDLFPSALLSNLTVAKTWSQELPANFGGGALMLGTHQWPAGPEWKLSLGMGGDSETLGQKRPDNPGGTADFFGFGADARALPDAVPDDRAANRQTTPPLTKDELSAVGRSFENTWTPDHTTAGPNLSFSASGADVHTLPVGKLAWLGAVQFGHREIHREAEVKRAKVSDAEGLTARESFRTETGTEQGAVGALAHLGYAPSDAHEFNALAFYTHVGDATAVESAGRSESDAADFAASRLQVVERALLFGQLTGFHRFTAAHALELRWQLNAGQVDRTEPDTRDLVYTVLDDGRRRYKDSAGSGERFFSTLTEDTLGVGVDLRLPFEPLAITLGSQVQTGDRKFDARRFRFEYTGSTPDDLFLPPETLFAPEAFGTRIRLDERTMAPDRYDAQSRVVAVHGGLDITGLGAWRILPGVRFEHATQRLEPGSPFATVDDTLKPVSRADDDVLPCLNVVYTLSEAQSLRAGYSRTLARPIFRELAPFLYYDFARRRSLTGNPDLREASIDNVDFRWEWYFGPEELFSVGAFYKRFQDPIEQVVVNVSAGDIGFANAEGADVIGGEVETRVSLGHANEALKDVRLGMNMAVVRSEVKLSAEDQRAQTNRTRPLQGQSPYVINAQVGWTPDFGLSATLLYNVAGPRITEVGIQGLPDAVEQSQHRLDASVSQKLPADLTLKLGLSNLLHQSQRVKQGPLTTYETQPGTSGTVSLEWKP